MKTIRVIARHTHRPDPRADAFRKRSPNPVEAGRASTVRNGSLPQREEQEVIP